MRNQDPEATPDASRSRRGEVRGDRGARDLAARLCRRDLDGRRRDRHRHRRAHRRLDDAYYSRYHSRLPFADAVKTGRTSGAPFVPGNPDGLNAAYQMEYPEGIHLFGVTAVARTPIGRVSLEATYRPNQPLGFNGSDLLAAFTSNAAPTPLRADATATPAGGVFRARAGT